MGKDARNYSELTKKRLYMLSGNKCAFPECPVVFTNPKNNTNFSNICHIEDAEEGGRYNPNMTDKQRASFDNLILLCANHHIETNDKEKYTVPILQKMKREHESNYLNQKIKSNPSMLKNTINAIANINLDEIQESVSLEVIDPSEKIKYNSIKRNIALIQEYKVYHKKINSLYDELELQGSIKKEKLLNNIKQIYIKIKGNYVLDSENSIEIIKQNSDNIIDDIYDELYTKMEKSNAYDEDIVLGIRLIMVDAFMRCKILEEPPK
ncbi:MAG: hypothetical protein A2033_10825 [Bacteroidetes bacterium GWA2_31_9]|nr:MAG: hypothetical protein A2033_10825 [Bacteroidetes bacterium GWA2_31_9]